MNENVKFRKKNKKRKLRTALFVENDENLDKIFYWDELCVCVWGSKSFKFNYFFVFANYGHNNIWYIRKMFQVNSR